MKSLVSTDMLHGNVLSPIEGIQAFKGIRQYFLISLLHFSGDDDATIGKGHVHWTGETVVNVRKGDSPER